MTKITYTNSVPLDAGICVISNDFNDAITQLTSELLVTEKFTRWHSRHSEALRVIVANVFNASSIDQNMAVGYSRDKSWYSNSVNNKVAGLKYESMVRLADSLADDSFGYLELKPGYWDRQRNTGHSARMRATPKLMELLCGKYGVDLLDVCRRRNSDTIILKDENKRRIGFVDTPDVIRMRTNLETINNMIASKFIGLAVFDETIGEINNELAGQLDEEGDGRSILDFSRIRLTRNFNNSSLLEGGRFYNGWWQEIPSRFRRYIRIDDIGIEEVDFSGLHLNLLYLLEGLPLPGKDVYSLEGTSDKSRNMFKITLQIMLNCSNKATATRKIKHEFPLESNPELFSKFSHAKIIMALRKKHKAIDHYFYTGHGVKLQFKDSEIAEDILLRLADKCIVALPVHDSFLVQRIHKTELEKTMVEVAFSKYSQILKIKKDLSAYEVDRANIAQEVTEEDIPVSVEAYERNWTSAKEYPEYLARMQRWHRDHTNQE